MVSSGGSGVKNPPANAGRADSILDPGRSLGEGNATYSSILAWETPWTEEPGNLQSHGVAKESDTAEQLNNSNNRT